VQANDLTIKIMLMKSLLHYGNLVCHLCCPNWMACMV